VSWSALFRFRSSPVLLVAWLVLVGLAIQPKDELGVEIELDIGASAAMLL